MAARRISAARTVTESDIAFFAGLTADFSPVHSDAAYAARGVFGRRVAHGLLGMSLAEGLLSRIPGEAAPAVAWEWSFEAPIFAGDTIHAVARSERAPRRPGHPAVERITVYRTAARSNVAGTCGTTARAWYAPLPTSSCGEMRRHPPQPPARRLPVRRESTSRT